MSWLTGLSSVALTLSVALVVVVTVVGLDAAPTRIVGGASTAGMEAAMSNKVDVAQLARRLCADFKSLTMITRPPLSADSSRLKIRCTLSSQAGKPRPIGLRWLVWNTFLSHSRTVSGIAWHP